MSDFEYTSQERIEEFEKTREEGGIRTNSKELCSNEFEKIREERQREVDKLSLELLSNTKHYKKYINKNHPEELFKRENNTRRFLKYKSRVAAIFIELLDEYEELGETSNLVGSELQTMFKECVQKTIQHLEWSEYNHNADSSGLGDDEDVMFARTNTFHKRKPRQNSDVDPYSYWGATIRKQGSNDI